MTRAASATEDVGWGGLYRVLRCVIVKKVSAALKRAQRNQTHTISGPGGALTYLTGHSNSFRQPPDCPVQLYPSANDHQGRSDLLPLGTEPYLRTPFKYNLVFPILSICLFRYRLIFVRRCKAVCRRDWVASSSSWSFPPYQPMKTFLSSRSRARLFIGQTFTHLDLMGQYLIRRRAAVR
jgi:hypothetical protein